jgi:protease-4
MINGSSAEFARQAFDSLKETPPKALILRIESGGGGVTASDQIWHQINEFKRRHPDVPVVASFGGVAASGGYYVAMPADHIVAERTCTTGSIGVMAPVFTFQETLKKLGIDEQWIEAPASPKKGIANNVFRNWTEKDVKVVKDLLGHMHQQFIDVVIEGRVEDRKTPLTAEQVKQLSQGQTFNAQEAKNNHLIDQVGYLGAAIAEAKSRAGISEQTTAHVTELRPQTGLFSSLLMSRSQPQSSLATLDTEKVRSMLHEATDMKLMYRAPIAAH